MKFDFIAIGDIVADAFIRLNTADIHTDEAKHRRELCVSYGDKIPYEFVKLIYAVGNSANAAVSASRLGLKSALVTNQGDDEIGKKNLGSLMRDKVATKYVISHPGIISNYHYVLWFEADRTILIKHEKYPYSLPEMEAPKWIYLSSLGENALKFHDVIKRFLSDHPLINLAFQPGTFQIKLGYEKIGGLYKRSKIFFCNKEEAQMILKTNESEPKKLMRMLKDLGPEVIVLTDGPAGAYAYNGRTAWFVPAYPDPAPPYERTGAGDAFASTVVAALGLGLPLEKALLWGPINSMSVVQKIGAQEGLLSREELEELLKDAPYGYKLKEI
ncbi:MAG: carbohydrate kinase family protein [bacterium]|nr:carbohydrate kinase family protein [bacterium]